MRLKHGPCWTRYAIFAENYVSMFDTVIPFSMPNVMNSFGKSASEVHLLYGSFLLPSH